MKEPKEEEVAAHIILQLRIKQFNLEQEIVALKQTIERQECDIESLQECIKECFK